MGHYAWLPVCLSLSPPPHGRGTLGLHGNPREKLEIAPPVELSAVFSAEALVRRVKMGPSGWEGWWIPAQPAMGSPASHSVADPAHPMLPKSRTKGEISILNSFLNNLLGC